MMQVCVILSSELHFDKGMLGFDSRVSIWHRCEWFVKFPYVVSCLLVCKVLAQ